MESLECVQEEIQGELELELLVAGLPDGGGVAVACVEGDPNVDDPAQRTGSHYLVIGDRHETGGSNNTASGTRASVSGGELNTAGASGEGASVSGESGNTASGHRASVLGGFLEEVGTQLRLPSDLLTGRRTRRDTDLAERRTVSRGRSSSCWW